MQHYVKISFWLIVIVFLNTSLGCAANVYSVNKDIINSSNIKTTRIKKGVLKDIKKSLSKQERKCSIIVSKIQLLKKIDENKFAEEWIVDVCRKERVFFVQIHMSPPMTPYFAIPKEERIAKEMVLWDGAKKSNSEEGWREHLYYIDEIESMNEVGK